VSYPNFTPKKRTNSDFANKLKASFITYTIFMRDTRYSESIYEIDSFQKGCAGLVVRDLVKPRECCK